MQSLNGFVIIDLLEVSTGDIDNTVERAFIPFNKQVNLAIARVLSTSTNVTLPDGTISASPLREGDYVVFDSTQMFEGIDGKGRIHYYVNHAWIVAKLDPAEVNQLCSEYAKVEILRT